jgi:hypothetical protein
MCSITEQYEERKREEKTNADSVERCGSCSLTSLVNLFSQPSVHLVRMYVEWMRRRIRRRHARSYSY